MNVNENLAIDGDVLVSAISVGQIIQGEDYRSVGRVFKWHNASCDLAVLSFVEDI